jgi:hypothetical protein
MSCAGIYRQGKVNVASRRRGAVLVLTALLLVFLVTLVAFTIDIGYMLAVRSEAKRATDAAALAGAGSLIDSPDAARVEAFEFLNRNPVGKKIYAGDQDWLVQLRSTGSDYVDSKEDIEIDTGHWEYNAPPPPFGQEDTRFQISDNLPSAIRVQAIQTGIPSLFGTLISNTGDFSIAAESIAGYQPRDIVLVLDFSGSMNDDSELKRITSADDPDRVPVEENLAEIWSELGTPTYGDLVFEPAYLTLTGVAPTEPALPQITVTFQGDDVYVESSKDLSNVVMEFSDGTREKIEDLSSPTGTFRGTGYNYYKTITKIWVKSGTNDSGEGPGYGERFEDTNAAVKQYFGLNTVAYPYPSGSWDDYINYCRNQSSVKNAGYKKKYGGMTLINYWLENKYSYSQTPDLWQVSAQPVKAVKDSVDVFMEYISEVDSDDQVGLVVYNSPSQHALLEHELTTDFDAVAETAQHRQAGHYNAMTNIGAGICVAREQLDANARTGAFKMIVLMTDGQANTSSEAGLNGPQYAISQAQQAAANGYPIVTISLGNGADTSLMQQIANLSEGAHFNIPGIGSGVTDYREGLLETFRNIANDRPLLLVK